MIAKSKKFKRKRLYKKVLFTIFSTLFALGIIAFLLLSNSRINQRKRELTSQIERLKEEIQTLEKKNEELKAGIFQISDESYLEKVAREKFLLKKEGEEVVVISPSGETEEEKTEEPKSLWQKILEKLEKLKF
ncbi:septum formation initiator family protein [Patescibacteria group bacterium]|nr:septum formation initiator family protein [Patescibacteria group bacterium]